MNIKYCSVLLFTVILLRLSVLAQNIKEVRQVGASLDRFALKFLATTCQDADGNLNLALSPYTIWTLMVIIHEGALENTAYELENTLGVPGSDEDKVAFRKYYNMLKNSLTKSGGGDVTLDTTNAIFTRADQDLKKKFVEIAQSDYKVDVTRVNFSNNAQAANVINDHMNRATRGRILNFVKPADLSDAQVFMASALYFKGAWAKEFNVSETTPEPFYNEIGQQIGEVEMMHNVDAYPFSLILNDRATAVELPYKGNTMCMIVILPKRTIQLQSVLDQLANIPFSSVIEDLEKAAQRFMDEPVQVHLPKFKVTSDLNLNHVLDQMGIKDLFDESQANLLGMFNHYLHVSRILQRAEIEVDEQGTVASSVSGSTFEYKTTPPRFIANKPFAYFIYNKETRGIIFAGKVSNPETLN